MVAPFVVAPPSAPVPGMPSRTRSTVAIFIVGAGLSVLLTVVADILLDPSPVTRAATTTGAIRGRRRTGPGS